VAVAEKKTKPFGAFEWMLALRYLYARRKKSVGAVVALFSLISIAIAVTALILAMAILNGFRQDLFNKILGMQGHIFIMDGTGNFRNYADLAERVKKIPGVTRAVPLLAINKGALAQALHSRGRTQTSNIWEGLPTRISGIRETDLKATKVIANNLMPSSKLDGFQNAEGIVLGKGLSDALGVTIGDSVSLLVGLTTSPVGGLMPRRKAYRVQAIFKTGLGDYDHMIFVPLGEAQKLYRTENSIDFLKIFTDNPDSVTQIKADIFKLPGFNKSVSDWRRTQGGAIYRAMNLERKVAFIVVALIMLVAALSIVSGLIVLVMDKGGDIAILRTMGAEQGTIMRTFFLSGASIGVVGTSIGLGLGSLIYYYIDAIHDGLSYLFGVRLFNPDVYFGLEKLPAKLELADVTAIVAITLTLSLLATLYPSWRAARLDPVEALRHE
jgi:lipoprotein-releasing system permease protein